MSRIRKFLFFCFLFFISALWSTSHADAATRYLIAGSTGSVAGYTTPETAASTWAQIQAVVQSGDTILCSGGVFSQTIDLANMTGVTVKQDPNRSQAIFDGTGINLHVLNLQSTSTNCVIEGLVFQNAYSSRCVGFIRGSGNIIRGCTFKNPASNYYNVSFAGGSGNTLERSQVIGASGTYDAIGWQNNASGNVYNNQIHIINPGVGNAPASRFTGSATINWIGNTVWGAKQNLIEIANSAGLIANIYNNILGPADSEYSYTGYIVKVEGANPTVNIDYNIYIPNAVQHTGQMLNYILSGVTDGGHSVIGSPQLASHPYDGYLMIGVDDGDDQYAYDLATLAESYGGRITWLVNNKTLETDGNPDSTELNLRHSRVTELYARGHDIASHMWSHSDMANLNAMTIKYNGTGGCSFTISGGSLIANAGQDQYDATIILAGKTLGNVIDTLVATGGYSASMITTPHAQERHSQATSLADVSLADISLTQTLLFNSTRRMTDEIDDTKSWLESLTGGTVTSLSVPYNSWASSVLDYARPLYHSIRGGSTSTAYMSQNVQSIDMAGTAVTQTTLLTGTAGTYTEAQVRERARWLGDKLTMHGSAYHLFAHNTSETSIQEWTWLLDEITQKYPNVHLLSQNQFYNTITTGGWVQNGNYWEKSITANTNLTLRSDSPSIDTGTSTSIVNDYAGNPIYGTPDIGAYEYQPPHTMGTSRIDVGAGARVYGDGKFRDNGTANSTLADLSVTPQSGSFNSYNSNEIRPKWMDIAILTWSNSGNHHKQWTENSSTIGAATTLHTIGDLEANKYYNVSVDGVLCQNIVGANGTTCNSGVCFSNAQGKISFAYSGGYSSHTFNVTEGDNSAPATTASPAGNTFNTTQAVTLTCDDGSGSGCDKTYYTLDGTSPTTSSTQYSSALSIPGDTTTTLKYFSKDLTGNSEAIKSQTYVIDTIAPDTTINSYPDILINSGSATFTFSANETATFQCKLDSGSYALCSSPKNYTDLVEGEHNFHVKSIDTAGNEDSTSATYTFTIDTAVPTVSNLSPDNTTLPVATTSTNLTITTNETTTCKYATTSETDYSSMTTFDSTSNTSHSTFVSGLNPGTTYDYYIKCRDSAANESSESHIAFSIAPEEQATSLNQIKIKIERSKNNLGDKLYLWKNKFKLKSADNGLANGTIKIYKNNKRIATVSIDTNGNWEKILKLKDEFHGWIKVEQYDQYGTLLRTDKAKAEVDFKKPEFTSFITPLKAVNPGVTALTWKIKENDKIDRYKVYLNGRIYTTKYASFIVPKEVSGGIKRITIRAYDRADNVAAKETYISVR